MYRYKYNKSYHHKSKRARRTTVFAVFVGITVIAGIGYIAYDIFKEVNKKDKPVSREVYSSVQGASINLFRTEYFQFQTDKTWQEVPSETRTGHFVYRSFKGPLVEHDIIVDINPAPEVTALSRTTRIMPVQIESDGRLTIVDGAGEHCGAQTPKTAAHVPVRITQKQVSFICSVDAVLYQVQVGVIGGTSEMLITRPSGAKATYRITYRNLKFTPDDSVLRNIITTFQAR